MSAGAADQRLAVALERAQAGDGRGFDELVGLLERPLLGFVRARGAADPHDATNEVLLRAFRGLDGFTGSPAELRAWLFRIARNLLIDERRWAGRRPDERPMPAENLPERAEPVIVDEVLEAKDGVERLLATLTADQREVVVLRVVAGLSVDETAAVVGRRPGAVRALQHRGLAQLRARLSGRP